MQHEAIISIQSIDSAKSVLPFNKVPGPSTLPVIGTLHHFLPGGE